MTYRELQPGLRIAQGAHGVLSNSLGVLAEDADATITLTRETFNDIILQRLTREDAITSGVVTIDGNSAKLSELLSYLDSFEFWCNIVEPL